MVQIPTDSDTIDVTARNPFADVQHAVCWTANYLAGLSYQYAYLKKSNAESDRIEAAKVRVDQVFEAVYRCQLVSGDEDYRHVVTSWGVAGVMLKGKDSTKRRIGDRG
jgi:hypothetical protein